MKSPRELRAWAAVKYRTGHRRWLIAPFEALTFTTGVPTETDVATDPDAVAAWVRAWRAFERGDHPGVDLEWVTRRWSAFGEQVLPLRVRIGGADQLALLAARSEDWSSLVDRTDQLRAAWPDADGLPTALASLAGRLRGLGPEEVPKLLAVVNWLVAHPESGLLRRQLPIEGVDTKWFERHSDLVQRLVEVLSGSGGLGLRIEPRRFRVRLLDETLAPHLPRDFTVPAAELRAMPAPEGGVLICENVQSVAALPSIPGVVAIHGQGLAVPELAMVPWIATARVFYWGDVDTYGFRILSLLRQVLPGVQSVLMDRPTLERYRALAVLEPSPYRSDITHLTSSEAQALRAIRDGDLRLEQERIDIGFAEQAVRALIGGCPPR